MDLTVVLLNTLLAVLTWTSEGKKEASLQVKTEYKPNDCSEVAQSGDVVTVHYTGRLENGVVFDTSQREGRQPFTFKLGAGKVIKGWEQGIQGMCVGEKRRLIIPPHLGYGRQGSPPAIPGDATLVFETELVSIESTPPIEYLIRVLRFFAFPVAVILTSMYLYKKYQTDESANKDRKGRRKKLN